MQQIWAAGSTAALRDKWEATGFQLERLQCAVECVEEEQRGLARRSAPKWTVSFRPQWTPPDLLASTSKPQVAIIRWAASEAPETNARAPECRRASALGVH